MGNFGVIVNEFEPEFEESASIVANSFTEFLELIMENKVEFLFG